MVGGEGKQRVFVARIGSDVAREFFREEGIASRLCLNALHDIFGEMGEQGNDLRVGEWFDRDGSDSLFAPQIPDQGIEFMLWSQFAIATGTDQEDALILQMMSEIGEEFNATIVSPVQVVEHQKQGVNIA